MIAAIYARKSEDAMRVWINYAGQTRKPDWPLRDSTEQIDADGEGRN